jgi:phage-related tail fiber protein
MNRPLAEGGVGGAIDGRCTAGGFLAGGGGVTGGAAVGGGSGARGPIDTGGIGVVCSVWTVTVGAGTGIGGGAAVRSARDVAHPAAVRRTTVAMKPLTLPLRRIAHARRHTT